MLVLGVVFCLLLLALLGSWWMDLNELIGHQWRQNEAGVSFASANSNPPMEVIANTVQAATRGDLQTVYKVEKGGSLWSISKKFGVSVKAVLEANKDRDEMLVVGERLVIPARR